MVSANDIQHGGQHYQQAEGAMQHWDFVAQAGLGYHDGNATKYVDRYPRKAGKLDLEKAAHYCDKCVELGLRPPAESRAIPALMAYTEGRSDLDRTQRGLLMLICTGQYALAASGIINLIAEKYPD